MSLSSVITRVYMCVWYFIASMRTSRPAPPLIGSLQLHAAADCEWPSLQLPGGVWGSDYQIIPVLNTHCSSRRQEEVGLTWTAGSAAWTSSAIQQASIQPRPMSSTSSFPLFSSSSPSSRPCSATALFCTMVAADRTHLNFHSSSSVEFSHVALHLCRLFSSYLFLFTWASSIFNTAVRILFKF